MAKKKKNTENPIENYYDLKVDKVDELVSILKGEDQSDAPKITKNIAEITGESEEGKKKNEREFDPYKIDKFSRIPSWVKALFVKWWFMGLAAYLFAMGLGNFILDGELMFLIIGVACGVINDIFVNPLFRYMESDRKEYDIYMMFPFPFKAYWTFLTNMIYYMVVVLGAGELYNLVNIIINAIAQPEKFTIYLAIEPITFGLFTLAVDMALIGIKNLVVYLVRRHKENKELEDV